MTKLLLCENCAKKWTDWMLDYVIGMDYCDRCWQFTTLYSAHRIPPYQPDAHLEAAYEERTDE